MELPPPERRQSEPIPPETSAADALWFAAKKLFPGGVKKLGVWRPLIVAGMAYFGYEDRQNHVRHNRNEREIEDVKAFVQSPPTNGRRIHEIPEPPMPVIPEDK